MAQLARLPQPTIKRRAAAPPARSPVLTPAARLPAPAGPAAHGIHPLAFRLPLAAAAWFLVSMALSFTDSLETGYLMAVVVGFGIVFFGLVTGLALHASGSARWLGSVAGFHRFARGDVGIATGRISDHEALVQLTVLPVTLALGGMAIGLVYLLVR